VLTDLPICPLIVVVVFSNSILEGAEALLINFGLEHFQPSAKPEDSLPLSQEPATGFRLEPDKTFR
jgi:hypothetical protein